jgi:hypothetical protein
MRGLNPGPLSPAELRENQRVTNEVLDELYFVREFEPGDGTVGLVAGTATAAAIAPQAVPGTPAIELPATAGGKPAWRINLRRKRRWLRAGLRLRIQHTATAGAAGNVRLELLLRSWSTGDVYPGRTDLVTGWTLASSAVASTAELLDYVTTSIVIPGDKDWLTLGFYRDKTNAADTSGSSLYITGISLEILPQG